jgi:hypothetical protein
MLVINPSEAEIVKQIFNLYKDGDGTQAIANRFNQLGIPTRLAGLNSDKTTISFEKTGIVKDRTSIKWDGNTILQILKNTIYKGERKFKGEVFTNIKPIIPVDVFDECNVCNVSTYLLLPIRAVQDALANI